MGDIGLITLSADCPSDDSEEISCVCLSGPSEFSDEDSVVGRVRPFDGSEVTFELATPLAVEANEVE